MLFAQETRAGAREAARVVNGSKNPPGARLIDFAPELQRRSLNRGTIATTGSVDGCPLYFGEHTLETRALHIDYKHTRLLREKSSGGLHMKRADRAQMQPRKEGLT